MSEVSVIEEIVCVCMCVYLPNTKFLLTEVYIVKKYKALKRTKNKGQKFKIRYLALFLKKCLAITI